MTKENLNNIDVARKMLDESVKALFSKREQMDFDKMVQDNLSLYSLRMQMSGKESVVDKTQDMFLRSPEYKEKLFKHLLETNTLSVFIITALNGQTVINEKPFVDLLKEKVLKSDDALFTEYAVEVIQMHLDELECCLEEGKNISTMPEIDINQTLVDNFRNIAEDLKLAFRKKIGLSMLNERVGEDD